MIADSIMSQTTRHRKQWQTRTRHKLRRRLDVSALCQPRTKLDGSVRLLVHSRTGHLVHRSPSLFWRPLFRSRCQPLSFPAIYRHTLDLDGDQCENRQRILQGAIFRFRGGFGAEYWPVSTLAISPSGDLLLQLQEPCSYRSRQPGLRL